MYLIISGTNRKGSNTLKVAKEYQRLLKEKMIETNQLIKTFLSTQKKTAFADVWPLMLDGEGKPNEALFVEDKLHMNQEGYAIWAKVLDKYLK